MMPHPSMEEIEALVYPKAVDNQYFRLSARVNAHLCVCRACKGIYDAMLDAREQAEGMYMDESDPQI